MGQVRIRTALRSSHQTILVQSMNKLAKKTHPWAKWNPGALSKQKETRPPAPPRDRMGIR